MIEDRNKTEITRRVTAAAWRWLDERGAKPIETEVPVDAAWVADIAATIHPTNTELVELKLMKRKPHFQHPTYHSWHEIAKTMNRLLTVAVEVKTTLADFRGDRKWTRPKPTNLVFLAIPKALNVGLDILSRGWGILEYSLDQGTTDYVSCTVPPVLHQVTIEQQLMVTHNIAVRRDHDTRYERNRKIQSAQRVSHNEDVSRLRLDKAIVAMMSVVKGEHGSLEGVLERHGVKKLSVVWEGELRKLFGIANRFLCPEKCGYDTIYLEKLLQHISEVHGNAGLESLLGRAEPRNSTGK